MYSNKDYSSEWNYHPDNKRFSAVDNTRFGVNIIPHTFEHTTFSDLGPGDRVNFEIDMLARYVARLMDKP